MWRPSEWQAKAAEYAAKADGTANPALRRIYANYAVQYLDIATSLEAVVDLAQGSNAAKD